MVRGDGTLESRAELGSQLTQHIMWVCVHINEQMKSKVSDLTRKVLSKLTL